MVTRRVRVPMARTVNESTPLVGFRARISIYPSEPNSRWTERSFHGSGSWNSRDSVTTAGAGGAVTRQTETSSSVVPTSANPNRRRRSMSCGVLSRVVIAVVPSAASCAATPGARGSMSARRNTSADELTSAPLTSGLLCARCQKR